MTTRTTSAIWNGLPLAFVLTLSLTNSLFAFDPPQTSAPASGQQEGNIIAQQDVIYGRVKGAALLADIAYPKGEGPVPAIISVHVGRWVGGHRGDKSAIVPKEWAGFGFLP